MIFFYQTLTELNKERKENMSTKISCMILKIAFRSNYNYIKVDTCNLFRLNYQNLISFC